MIEDDKNLGVKIILSMGDRGHYITNPNNALFTRGIPQNCQTFAVFDPQMGILMTPA